MTNVSVAAADSATDIATISITTSSTAAATVGYLVRTSNACKQPQKSMQWRYQFELNKQLYKPELYALHTRRDLCLEEHLKVAEPCQPPCSVSSNLLILQTQETA